jgi:hypothetical protein
MLVIYLANLANAFICRASLQAKNDLTDISVFLSTGISPQNKTTQQKSGVLETGRECRYLFPKKIQTAMFWFRSRKGLNTRSVLRDMARVEGRN